MASNTAASAIQKATVESSIINERLTAREFPDFQPYELKLGPVLGKGAFGIVHQVERIELQADGTAREEGKEAKEQEPEAEDLDSTHYAVASARTFMADNVLRDGKDARYALKKLKSMGTGSSRDRAMMDLAIEARILSMLWHPNIIKMRGRGCYLQPDCFIVLDRLYDTLQVRIRQWRKRYTMFAKRNVKEEVQQERLAVAYDVSSAFRYLNQHNIVYRDVKQENMGFDVRGDIKVFDFGLAKSLGGARKVPDGYQLTPRTGTIPYMAPEIILAHPYSTNVDVYSLAILFYEIWSARDAFVGYSAVEYTNRCVVQGQRPSPIPRTMPRSLRSLLPTAWLADPKQRATVNRLFEVASADWYEYSSSRDTNRDEHMRDKSVRSQRMLMKGQLPCWA